ncbi:MAG TPA: hypothetical protein VM818_21015 [Vicinamibacterales bacterium]|nr:hypothetical protein [Vicinamibacterales bacterium]
MKRVGVALIFSAVLALGGADGPLAGQCVDLSKDPAGCQPSTLDTPIGQMPSVRVNRQGRVDPFSSEEDARAGAAAIEERLHLFRNFEHLHWVVTVPSVKDPATGAWKGGDLDASGDGRGLGIAGNCIFVGHANGAGVKRSVNIFKIQPNPERQPPVQVGEIPAFFLGNQGFDERELRALVYKTSGGEDRYILIRNAGTNTEGRMETVRINPDTCLPVSKSESTDFHGQSHEFYLWHDPANSNRILVHMAIWTAGLPDPENPGLKIADMVVMAITDEKTGEILPKAKTLATFSLQEVGGPPLDERPDATGLFSDGRFLDFSEQKNRAGQAGNFQSRQQNKLHSMSVTDDGERVYVAGTTAGFYVLDSEAVAHNTDAALAAGTAGCNQRSTIVSVDGVIDASKLPSVVNDCVHMVVNNDPGLKAFLASGASAQAKAERYLVLMTRSRFDVYPPINALPTGTHSAVFIPDRPALVKGNTKKRPAYVWLTDENGGCPLNYARMVSVEAEATPIMIGAFAVPDNQIEECLEQAITEPSGEPRRRVAQQNHNPTAFKNLVFNTWYGHGLRAIDISLPHNPREVGYALTIPHGIARTYPIFKDGLIYWVDNDTGLHVARYTGPRREELPGPGSGVYEGNATSPHR